VQLALDVGAVVGMALAAVLAERFLRRRLGIISAFAAA
jgi:hypothetical protein